MAPIRIRRRTFTLAALAAGAGLGRAQARPERARVALAVPAHWQMQYLPLTVALTQGFFRAQGLEVDIGDEAGADLACGAFDQVLALRARGLPQQSLVLLARTPALALGVSTRWLPHYAGWEDLRGRRIGLGGPGATPALVARVVLARAGLGPADVSFVALEDAMAAAAALREGQVQALCHADPAMTALEQRALVRIVSDTRTLKGTQAVFGGPMPSACLHAPQEFVQRHPATCQALALALVQALKWLRTAGPRDLLRAVPEAWMLGDRALYLAAFERQRESFSPDGLMGQEAAATALRAMAQVDPALRPERLDLARSFTNEFVLPAKERLRA